MKRLDAAALVVVSGLFALWVAFTDTALLYVRPAARLWLELAGATLVVVGIALLVLSWGRRANPEAVEDTHHVGRVGWLLAVPVVVAVAVGSNPLGSYAAGRQNAERTLPAGSFDLEQYLNAGSFGGQAPALRVLDFVRAASDPDDQVLLAETRVTLTGFVTEDDTESHPHGFLLTRFTIGCCAADALAVFVRVQTDGHDLPATDSWVEVVGTLVLGDAPDADEVPAPPTMVAAEVRPGVQPDEVYEYPP